MLKEINVIMNRINSIKTRFGVIPQTKGLQQKTSKNSTFETLKNNAIQNIQNTHNKQNSGIVVTNTADIKKVADFYAQKNNISPSLLKALIQVESNYNPKTVSQNGAKGLMQLMPSMLKSLQVTNPFSPEENIRAGSTVLKNLLQKHNNDYKKALADYQKGFSILQNNKTTTNDQKSSDFVRKVIQSYMLNK